MKKSKKNNLIVFIICFVIAWLAAIFYFQKNDFDIEYREKGITTATIFNFSSRENVDELYDGKKTIVNDIDYLEYSYFVEGVEYKYGSEYYKEGHSLYDKIKIEYVKSNPASSRIRGSQTYKYNFFIRNLIIVSIFSFFGMLGVFYIFDRISNKDTGWHD